MLSHFRPDPAPVLSEFQGRRKAFRLYTEHTQSSLQIRLNDRDITDTVQNGTIVIKDARKQQHLVLYFQETK